MSIRIDGGTVVGWSGAGHEIIPNGTVLIEGDTIKSVGTDKAASAERVIDAAGKIVCPGFVNLHVHSQLNVGEYLVAASGARPADVFNAATIGGANALGRLDLGRLAAGASGANVETVIVDGEVVIANGRSRRINDEELLAQFQAGANRAWDNWAARDWNGRSVEQIIPPAFPIRKS